MKILPLVNIFQNGFEVWETRQPTPDEIIKNIQAKLPINEIHQEIKTQLIQTIQTPEDAIKYCLEKNGYCNTFENFIDDELSSTGQCTCFHRPVDANSSAISHGFDTMNIKARFALCFEH